MARIKSINRDLKDVWTYTGQGNFFVGRTHCWRVEVDENVIFDFGMETEGPRAVRFGHGKPHAQVVELVNYIGGPWDFKPDNEDRFFWAEYQNEAGEWVNADTSEGHSSNRILSEGSEASGVEMAWVFQNSLLWMRAR